MPQSIMTTHIHYVKKIQIEYSDYTANLHKFFSTRIITTDENGAQYIFSLMSDEKIEVEL